MSAAVSAAGWQVEKNYAYGGVHLLVVTKDAPQVLAAASAARPSTQSNLSDPQAALEAAGAWRLAASVQPEAVQARAHISVLSSLRGVSYVALETRASIAQAASSCSPQGTGEPAGLRVQEPIAPAVRQNIRSWRT